MCLASVRLNVFLFDAPLSDRLFNLFLNKKKKRIKKRGTHNIMIQTEVLFVPYSLNPAIKSLHTMFMHSIKKTPLCFCAWKTVDTNEVLYLIIDPFDLILNRNV